MTDEMRQPGKHPPVETRNGGPDANVNSEQVAFLARQYAKAVYSDIPAEDFPAWEQGAIDRAQRLVADPNTLLAFVDDVLVGIAGWNNIGQTENGQDVLEVTMTTTHPGYRGQGIASKLYEERETMIRDQYPKGIIGGVTHSEIIPKILAKRGFTEMDLGQYLALTNDHRLADLEQMQSMEFRAFTLDLAETDNHRGDYQERMGDVLSE